MNSGRYVGRVGALAVALGIGSAVATPAAIAWAAPETDSTSTSGTTSHDKPSSTPKPKKKAKSAEPAAGTTDTPNPKPTKPKPKKSSTKNDANKTATDKPAQPTPTAAIASLPKAAPAEPSAVVQAPVAASAPQKVTTATATASVLATTQATSVKAATTAAPVSALDALVRPLVSTILNTLNNAVANSPLGWLMLGAARRDVGATSAAATAIASVALAANQVATTASTNQPPSAFVIWDRPDATTGRVTGHLTTYDPEFKLVTVGLVQGPSAGTLGYNATTKTITYTPTTAQRFAAFATSGTDTIAMTIKLSDGVNTNVPVVVNIPVSPSPFYTSADLTGVTNATAVATTNTRTYVVSRSTGTISVFDAITNEPKGTYQVNGAPDGIAIKSDGTRLYVSSSTDNTVKVVDAATGTVKATLAVNNPTAITISPNGATVYVANGNSATVTKISTSTNKVTGTVKLTAGLTPTQLAVSSDGKKIFVASSTATGGAISWFSSGATTATLVSGTDITGTPVGMALGPAAYPMLYVADVNGGLTLFDTLHNTLVGTWPSGLPFAGIAVSRDGSTLMAVSDTGLLAAINTVTPGVLGVATIRDTTISPMSTPPTMVVTPDGTQMYVTDSDTNTVHVISLVPPNIPPFSDAPYYSISNPALGTLSGTIGAVDYDGDPLTYTVTAKTTKGKLTVNANGTYIYTPTAAARHAASVPDAPTSVTQDSFKVTVSDGRHGSYDVTIPLTISPANKVPTVTTTIGNPNTTTGVVKGTVASTDGDSDKRTYTFTQGAKGTVTVTSTGAFTYTPTTDARTAALAPGATYADKMDTFSVTVDDGHGGVVPVTVNVRIGAANVKPVVAKPVISGTDARTGVVTGTVTATDANGDTLSYAANKTTKGVVVVNSDGSFTYTPTTAARAAASKAGASTATKTEAVTFTVKDGFGGSTTTSVTVTIAPNPTVNTAPTNVHATGVTTSSAIGEVTGTITATDAEGDAITYSLGSDPTTGTAKVSADGKFSYIPTVDARYLALAFPNQNTDSFTVNATDAFGLTTSATVTVTIAPPSATAIDQRATTVGVTTQQMYFYSQDDTTKAMAVLKAAGVGTIRIMLPWAGVEPSDGTYDWSAVDRVVTAANASGIKVLATINTTPLWAVIPGDPQYSGRPADLTQVSNIMTLIAQRYQGQIAAYEIWNEENYNGFWAPTPDAAAYTALLKVSYTAIKAVDPDAMVIAGAIAAANETPGGPVINPVTYLKEMYAAGAAGYFDALAFHPYQYAVSFSTGLGHDGVPITQAQAMHEVMAENGDGYKKIWVTEYGEPTSVVSEATQAAFIADFLRTWRTLSYAGPAFIHTFMDYDDPDPAQASMGLLHKDWTPKPALGVVSNVIAENAALNA